MIRRVLTRAAAVSLLAPYLTLASALAPTHIHESTDEHEPAVAHSHFAPHHVEERDHGEGAGIDHNDDEHVVWLDGAALHEVPFQVHSPSVAVLVSNEPVRVERQWSVTPSDAAAPAHGPPKPTPPFRGPPSTSELI